MAGLFTNHSKRSRPLGSFSHRLPACRQRASVRSAATGILTISVPAH